MIEYIEREALKNDIAKSTEPFNTGSVFRAINRQIAADVEPVRHGWWIEQGDGSHFCSECACDARWKVDDISGAKVSFVEELSNYCPNCGAKMDGGAD